MYGYQCEYCEGTVRWRSLSFGKSRIIKREAFKHRDRFVILENVTIGQSPHFVNGVCDNCSNRYYSADILHTVHSVATGVKTTERTEQIPVMYLESA